MVQTKTAGGVNERGPATQRHFVRDVESIENVSVVVSYSSGVVSISVKDDSKVMEVVDMAAEYGGEAFFETITGRTPSHRYECDSSVSLGVSFTEE